MKKNKPYNLSGQKKFVTNGISA